MEKQELLKRLETERHELDEKLIKLRIFIDSDTFKALPSVHQAMLQAQEKAMSDYIRILGMRMTNIESNYEEGSVYGVSFSIALSLLKAGFPVARTGWNNKNLVIFKQVPADIAEEIIPKMQSLPEEAKKIILESTKKINYRAQCLIFNKNTGRADSWTPSITDIMADDWMLVL